jgi:predicted permease
MGGDARLMAAIITATTILSFVTMPIAITFALR